MSDPTFRLYNALTRQVEPLVTSQKTDEGKPLLRFYSCGPTVYSYAHIGNFRTFLTADLIVRTAEALGWQVNYVSNVTDVGHLTEDDTADASGEDRMAKALKSKEGEQFANVWDLARHYTKALLADWQALNLREPNIRPRATEHVREQIRAVEALLANGHAYETDDGVYFHVPSFDGYGKLSGTTTIEELTRGSAAASRDVVVDECKRDPRDFALWKKDDGHLMQWHSPFGWGFPGWHLECSVMAQKYLGETIDLHGGGEDLRFPHHECEIAQAEAVTSKPFANHWSHTRFLQVEGKKMSKRDGNFLTVHDLTASPDNGGRADWGAPTDPLALRLALISGHYGKPFNFTQAALKAAAKNIQRYRDAHEVVQESLAAKREGDDNLDSSLTESYTTAVAAMAEDLNTPEAIAAAYQGVNVILGQNREAPLSGSAAETASSFLDRINALLGIVNHEVAGPTTKQDDGLAEQVESLIQQRTAARASKDWALADEIRAELDALAVEIMDSPTGTTWRRKL